MTFKGDISMFHKPIDFEGLKSCNSDARNSDTRNILEEVKHELIERASKYGSLSEVFAEPAKQRYGKIKQELIDVLAYIQELEK